ncbi:MAG TPA: transglycosylase SLT domain-containing protein [Verrucomicrobiae bacterium]|nr:transglycosylase SLT domain-containing protein [Verrucomicrobiae bacterium]
MLRCIIFSKQQFCESYQGHRNGLGQRLGRLASWLTLVLSVATLSLLASPAARANQEQSQVTKPSPWTLCAKATNLIERQEGVPRQLLRAISKVESGRFHQKKRVVMAWPWTVMAEGRGRYLPTKAAAIAEVEGLKARGIRNIDVGCMQVNLFYHPHAFANLNQAFDPVANVSYAASYLKNLKIEEGSWAKAVARYHSADPVRYKQYRMKVHVAWRQERAKFLAALSEVQATQYADLDPLPTIMTWHQASVAEPFHNQLATLTFASAEFEDGTENEMPTMMTMAALAYQPALPVSIDALESPSEFTLSVAIPAREPIEPDKPTMTAAIAAREPAGYPQADRFPVSIAAREPPEFRRRAPAPVSIAAREPADVRPLLHMPVSISAREPADVSYQGRQVALAAREPAEWLSIAAAGPWDLIGGFYPGFVRAEPVKPGSDWSSLWPLIEPHAERFGRGIIGLLQSDPGEPGGNG